MADLTGWVCVACHGPAIMTQGVVHCVDSECGVARILPAIPDRMPWEPEP